MSLSKPRQPNPSFLIMQQNMEEAAITLQNAKQKIYSFARTTLSAAYGEAALQDCSFIDLQHGVDEWHFYFVRKTKHKSEIVLLRLRAEVLEGMNSFATFFNQLVIEQEQASEIATIQNVLARKMSDLQVLTEYLHLHPKQGLTEVVDLLHDEIGVLSKRVRVVKVVATSPALQGVRRDAFARTCLAGDREVL
jgi:hypothetical protein